MRRQGNQLKSTEQKIKDAGKKAYRDGIYLRPWVICVFLREQIGFTLVQIENQFDEDKGKNKSKLKFPTGFFRKGGKDPSHDILKIIMEGVSKFAQSKYPDKYDLSTLTVDLLFKDFDSLAKIKGFVLNNPNVHIFKSNELSASINNEKAYEELSSFVRSEHDDIRLLSGGNYSGKTSTMLKVYNELKERSNFNLIFIDISTITNVAQFQLLLFTELQKAYEAMDYSDEINLNLSLIELLNLRNEWCIFIDTGNRTVYGAEIDRFVTQNDYLTFFMKLKRRINSRIKVVISEQFSNKNLPQHFKIEKIVIEPINPINYIKGYGFEALPEANKKYINMSANFEIWSEDQRYIYSHLFKLLRTFNAPNGSYNKLNQTFEKRFDINKLLLDTILEYRSTKFKRMQLFILESLLQIEEGFQFSTFEKLMQIHIEISEIDSYFKRFHFDLRSFLDKQNADFFTWLNLLLVEPVSENKTIMLQPALRPLLTSDFQPSEQSKRALLLLTKSMVDKTNVSAVKRLLNHQDLSIAENYLTLHKVIVPALHAFKLYQSIHLNEKTEQVLLQDNIEYIAKRKEAIRTLYNLYDQQIELNPFADNIKSNGFALGKIFLSYDVKLKLVSDIISLNGGGDNGRLLTSDSLIMSALEVDEIFYLLESLSVASIACFRYGSIAKASYLLSSLFNYLQATPNASQTDKTMSIARRAQYRIYQNDIVLKLYFNPTSPIEPSREFVQVLLKDIMSLSKQTSVYPSISFYYRRLLKLWVDYARTLITISPQDSFKLIKALSYAIDLPSPSNKAIINSDISQQLEAMSGSARKEMDIAIEHRKTETLDIAHLFTRALAHLISVDLSHSPKKEKHFNLQSKLNTYTVTSIIYITQRNLLKKFIDSRTNKRANQGDRAFHENLRLLAVTFENLIAKSKDKYSNGVQDFATLISVKTALLRGRATCLFILKNKSSTKLNYDPIVLPRFRHLLQEIDILLLDIAAFDTQALFLKTDSSHLISSSSYLVRQCIDKVLLGESSFNVKAFEDTSREIELRRHQLKETREQRLTLELDLFLKTMELLSYISLKQDREHSSDSKKKTLYFRMEFSSLNDRFKEQGREKEVTPIFNEIFSYINMKTHIKEEHLKFIILMFF